jgi:cytochrome c biogenesis protein CcdA
MDRSSSVFNHRVRSRGEELSVASEQVAAKSDEGPRKALLLTLGLALGILLAYVLYEFFDPVNLFALRLTESSVGTTNVTALSVGVVLAFVSGATMIFTPCGMPLIFALNSMAREGKESDRSWLPPFVLFTAGIAGVMAVWGAIVGLAGGGIVDFLADPARRFTVTEILYSALGVLALLMALWEFGWVRLPRLGGHRGIPASVARLSRYPRSLAMGAALGGGFGVGCPFPTYQAVLAWAALVGNPLYGAVVLAANALGRAAPLYVVGGLAYHGTEQRAISRWLIGNSARAKLINGTGLAAFAGLMIALWAGFIPLLLGPGG